MTLTFMLDYRNFLKGTQKNLMVAVLGRWTEGLRLEGFSKYTVTF